MTSKYIPRSLLVTALCLMMGTAATAQKSPDERIDLARSFLAQLSDSQRLLSKERTDWAIEKDMLQGRIDLVAKQIEVLQGKIAETGKSMKGAIATTKELEGKLARISEVKKVLGGRIGRHEQRVLELLPRLPSPISEKLKSVSQLIPTTPEEEKKIELGPRYLNVIGVLNRVNKFNTEIHLSNEVRTLSHDRTTSVNVLYVGIGQGYYVNAKGNVAGYGTSTLGGWKWEPANDSGQEILDAIGIFNNEKAARFVRLPIRVVGKKGE